MSGEAAGLVDFERTLRQLGTEARRLPADDSRRVRCLNLITEAESSLASPGATSLGRGERSPTKRMLATVSSAAGR